MNVSRTTQFELLLFSRTLKMMKSIPGLSITTLFAKLMPYLKNIPNCSLSAYWKERNPDIVSLISGQPEEGTKDPILLADVKELEHLKNPEHTEARHDPLLVIRSFYETAVQELQFCTTAEQRCILLETCLCIAMKSARLSLLLHSLMLMYMYEQDSKSIDPAFIQEFYSICQTCGIQQIQKTNQNQTSIANILKEENISHLKEVCPTNLVLSFGKADHGKLGLGDVQLNRYVPTMIEQLSHCQIIKVVSMSTYCLAVSKYGKVYIWGTGGNAAAANASNHPATSASNRLDIRPQLLDAISLKLLILDIACGLGHTLFLTNTGRVYAWGNGGNGRLGLGDLHDRNEACLISGLQEEIISQIVCGASHSLALTNKGQVYAWGKNTQGQCGQGNLEDQLKPMVVKRLAELSIVQITAGWEHSISLTQDGKMYSWGCGYKDNRRGIIPPVLGLGHSECRPIPELISSIESTKIVSIASGWDHCLALDEKGKLLSWGSGQNGKLGQNNEENIAIPCYVNALDNVKIVSYSAGCEHSAAISEDGLLFMWGHGEGGRLGMGNSTPTLVPIELSVIPKMNIRPHFVHCGDKFTIIIAQPLIVNPLSVSMVESMHHMKQYWKLTDLQTIVVEKLQSKAKDTNSYPIGPSSYTAVMGDTVNSMIHHITAHLQQQTSQQNAISSETPVSVSTNTDVMNSNNRQLNIMLAMLYSMVTSLSSRMNEAVPMTRTATTITSWKLFPERVTCKENLLQKYIQFELDDVEYGVECSEDSYFLLSVYLDVFSPYYSSGINEMISFCQDTQSRSDSLSLDNLKDISTNGSVHDKQKKELSDNTESELNKTFLSILANAVASSENNSSNHHEPEKVEDEEVYNSDNPAPISWQQAQYVLLHILLITSMNIHVLSNLYKQQQKQLQEESLALNPELLLDQSSAEDVSASDNEDISDGGAGGEEKEKPPSKKPQHELKKKDKDNSKDNSTKKNKTVWDFTFVQRPHKHAAEDNEDEEEGEGSRDPQEEEYGGEQSSYGYEDDDGMQSEYTEDENRKKHSNHHSSSSGKKSSYQRRGGNREEDDDQDNENNNEDDLIYGDESMDDEGNEGDLESSVDSSVISGADRLYDSPYPRPISASSTGASIGDDNDQVMFASPNVPIGHNHSSSTPMLTSLSTTTLTIPDLSSTPSKLSNSQYKNNEQQEGHILQVVINSDKREDLSGLDTFPSILSPSLSFESIQQGFEESGGVDHHVLKLDPTSSQNGIYSKLENRKDGILQDDMLLESIATTAGLSQFIDKNNEGLTVETASNDGQDEEVEGEDELDEDDLMEEYYDPDQENMQLQEILLSQLQEGRTSPLAALLRGIPIRKDVPLNILQTMNSQRQRDYLPKIRNQINTISSTSYLCIQQSYTYMMKHLLPTLIINGSNSLSSNQTSQINQFFSSTYQIWELTQLITYAGYELLYDSLEQQSVLLQIIQSPTSFLYIIPGIMYGAYKKKSLDYQDQIQSFFDIRNKDDFFKAKGHIEEGIDSNVEIENQNAFPVASPRAVNVARTTQTVSSPEPKPVAINTVNVAAINKPKNTLDDNNSNNNKQNNQDYVTPRQEEDERYIHRRNQQEHEDADDEQSLHDDDEDDEDSHLGGLYSHRDRPNQSVDQSVDRNRSRQQTPSSRSAASNDSESQETNPNAVSIFDLIQLLLQLVVLYQESPVISPISLESSSQTIESINSIMKSQLPHVYHLKVVLYKHIQTSFSTFIASLLAMPLSWYFSSSSSPGTQSQKIASLDLRNQSMSSSQDHMEESGDEEDVEDAFPWNQHVEYFFQLIFQCIYLDLKDQVWFAEYQTTENYERMKTPSSSSLSSHISDNFAVMMIECLLPLHHLHNLSNSSFQTPQEKDQHTIFFQYLTMILPMIKNLIVQLHALSKDEKNKALSSPVHPALQRVWEILNHYTVYYYLQIQPQSNLLCTSLRAVDLSLTSVDSFYQLDCSHLSWKKLRSYLQLSFTPTEGSITTNNTILAQHKERLWLWSLWSEQFHLEKMNGADMIANGKIENEENGKKLFTTFSPIPENISSEQRNSEYESKLKSESGMSCHKALHGLFMELLSHPSLQNLPWQQSDLPVSWFRKHCQYFIQQYLVSYNSTVNVLQGGLEEQFWREKEYFNACLLMFVKSFGHSLSIPLLVSTTTSQLHQYTVKEQALLLSWACSSLIMTSIFVNKTKLFSGLANEGAVVHQEMFVDHETIDLLYFLQWKRTVGINSTKSATKQLGGVTSQLLQGIFQQDFVIILENADKSTETFSQTIMIHLLESVNCLQKELSSIFLMPEKPSFTITSQSKLPLCWPIAVPNGFECNKLNTSNENNGVALTKMEISVQHSLELQLLSTLLSTQKPDNNSNLTHFSSKLLQSSLWMELLHRQELFSQEWLLFILHKVSNHPTILPHFFSLFLSGSQSKHRPNNATLVASFYQQELTTMSTSHQHKPNIHWTIQAIENITSILSTTIQDISVTSRQLLKEISHISDMLQTTEDDTVWQFVPFATKHNINQKDDKEKVLEIQQSLQTFRESLSQYHIFLQLLYSLFGSIPKPSSYSSETVTPDVQLSQSYYEMIDKTLENCYEAWANILEQYSVVYNALMNVVMTPFKHTSKPSEYHREMVVKQIFFDELQTFLQSSYMMIDWLFQSNNPLDVATYEDLSVLEVESKVKVLQRIFSLIETYQHSYTYYYNKLLSHISTCQQSFITYLYHSMLPTSSLAFSSLSSSAPSSMLSSITSAGGMGPYYVDMQSPLLFANVYTPNGDCGISFWFYLPKALLHDARTSNESLETCIKDKDWTSVSGNPTKSIRERIFASKDKKVEERTHILTRYPETNDIQMIDLLTNQDPAAIDSYTLSVYLVHTITYEPSQNDGEAELSEGVFSHSYSLEVHLIVFLFELLTPFEMKFVRTDKNLNQHLTTKRKVNKRIYFRSSPLVLDTWLHCAIDIQQAFVAPTPPNSTTNNSGNSAGILTNTASSNNLLSNIFSSRPSSATNRPGSARNRPGSATAATSPSITSGGIPSEDPVANVIPEKGDCIGEEITKVRLFINGECIDSKESLGGKWPLHQHVIIGKLPTALGQSAMDQSETATMSTKSIILTDVVWIPASLVTKEKKTSDPSKSMSEVQHDHNLLYFHFVKGNAKPIVSTSSHLALPKDTIATSIEDEKRLNNALTTVHPPSHMLRLLSQQNDHFTRYFRQLNLISSSIVTTNQDKNNPSTTIWISFYSHHLMKSLQCIRQLLPLGNSTTQSTLLLYYQSLWQLFPDYLPHVFPLNQDISANTTAENSVNNSENNSPMNHSNSIPKRQWNANTSGAAGAVGSAFNAALQHKLGGEYLQVLKVCIQCIGSFLPSIGTQSWQSHNFSNVCQEVLENATEIANINQTPWEKRMFLHHTNNANYLNLGNWYPEVIEVKESLYYQQMIQIFSFIIQQIFAYGKPFHNVEKVFDMVHKTLVENQMVDNHYNASIEDVLNLLWVGYQGGYFPQLQPHASIMAVPSRYLAFPYPVSFTANSTSSSGNATGATMAYQEITQFILTPTALTIHPVLSQGNSEYSYIAADRVNRMKYEIQVENSSMGYDIQSHCETNKNELIHSIPFITSLQNGMVKSIAANDMLLSSLQIGNAVTNQRNLCQPFSTKLASTLLLPSQPFKQLLKQLWSIGKVLEGNNTNTGTSGNGNGQTKQKSVIWKQPTSKPSGANITPVGLSANRLLGSMNHVVSSSTPRSESMESKTNNEGGSAPMPSTSMKGGSVNASGKKSEGSNVSRTPPSSSSGTSTTPNPFLQLFYVVSTLRSINVHLSASFKEIAATAARKGSQSTQILHSIWTTLQPFVNTPSNTKSNSSLLSLIASIASLDTKEFIYQCLDPFHPLHYHHHLTQCPNNTANNNLMKGIQLDVIRNLLKETDIHFLEQLSLSHWSYFSTFPLQTAWQSQILFESYYTQFDSTLIQLIPIAGDVMITGSNGKIKAVSHFPSVKLANIALPRQSGRWYYECTLLSDGLIQIGWANSQFKCDPICGQGVGDHIQSWSYDGLRMKKWNVSCESYGKRWKAGDVIGILVDMDLLEMKFFLNGEDLGVAFEDFSGDLFPAVSLNVRQCIRMNFGQGKFLYPPHLCDGYAFRPIIYALAHPLNGKGFLQQKQRVASTQSGLKSSNGMSSKNVTFHDSAGASSSTVGSPTRANMTNNAGPSANPSGTNDRVSQRTPVLFINDGTAVPNVSTPAALSQNPDAPVNTVNNTSSQSGADILVVNYDEDQVNAESKVVSDQTSATSLLPSIEELEQQLQRQLLALSIENNNDSNGPLSQGSVQNTEDGNDFSEAEEPSPPYQLQTSGAMSSSWPQEDLESRTRMEVETEQEDYEEEDEDEEEEEEEEDGDEGEDDEDEEAYDEAMQTNGNRRNRRRFIDGGEQEVDEEDDENEEEDEEGEQEDEESGHLLELRRQTLIENLLGMGFPIDWALRAAEQCDVTTTESAAIAWILERMEMEQNKLNELDGDSSSRAGAGEDYDEMENSHMSSPGLEYFMQRHGGGTESTAAASNATAQVSEGSSESTNNAENTSNASNLLNTFSQELRSLNLLNRHMVTEEMVELLESAAQQLQQEVENSGANGGTHGNLYSPGSPPREDFFQFLQASSRQFAALAGNHNNAISTAQDSHSSNSSASNSNLGDYSQFLASQFGSNKNANEYGTKGGNEIGNPGNARPVNIPSSSTLPPNSHDVAYQDLQSNWNSPASHTSTLSHRFLPLLQNYSILPYRHDLEKQEVLWQVEELDLNERIMMLFICEWLLTIYYARMIIFRVIQFQLMATQIVSRTHSNDESNEAASSMNQSHIPSDISHALTQSFVTPQQYYSYYQFFFTQQILSSTHTNISHTCLSPLVAHGNLTGDLEVKLPPCMPFYTNFEVQRYRVLQLLQLSLTSNNDTAATLMKEHVENEMSVMSIIVLHDWIEELCSTVYYDSSIKNTTIKNDEEETKQDPPQQPTIGDEKRALENPSDVCALLNYFIQQSLVQFELAHTITTTGISSITNSPAVNTPTVPHYHISLPENVDWLMTSIDKHATMHDLYIPNSTEGSQQQETSAIGPNVLYSYFVLKSLYTIIMKMIDHPPSSSTRSEQTLCIEEIIFQKPTSTSTINSDDIHPFANLFTVETLNRMMKILLTSNNDSMKHCLNDLLSMALFTILRSLQCTEIIGETLNQPGKSTSWELTVLKPSWNQITTAEYYLVIKREKLLLQQLTYRMHFESLFSFHDINSSNISSNSRTSSAAIGGSPLTVLNLLGTNNSLGNNIVSISNGVTGINTSGLYSRYTRSIGLLLSTWYDLRIQLHLFPYQVFSQYALTATATTLTSCMPSHIVMPDNPTTGTSKDGILRVTQLSSCSVTVTWQLPSTNVNPNHPDGNYNLYLISLSSGILNEEPVLVLEALSLQGIYRIDELDSDAFYHVMILSISQYNSLYGSNNASSSDSNTSSTSTMSANITPFPSTLLLSSAIPANELNVKFLGGTAPNNISTLQLLVSTDTEPLFTFFPEATSSNIILTTSTSSSPSSSSSSAAVSTALASNTSHHPTVTLRNVTNKKWSTARANIPLLHGVYKWEVLIDRCVSKNIFLGVATKECKLDNYVGCDAHGWAFLANKAIWHNKSKLKTYGELFRTGDIISIVLDVDVGHLIYYLNDKCMGVALENLVGPLYPAFSLYNEDDSVTILSMKSISSSTSISELNSHPRWKGKLQTSSSGGGSFLAESYLDRMYLMRNLMQFLSGSHTTTSISPSKNKKPFLQKPFPSLFPIEVLSEIYARYLHWTIEGIVYRSITYQGMYVLVQVSSSAITQFLTPPAANAPISPSVSSPSPMLHILEIVKYEKFFYRVIGVGAHRLWLQALMLKNAISPISNNYHNEDEYIPLTYDTYTMMLQKGILELNPIFPTSNIMDINPDVGLMMIHSMHSLPSLITSSVFMNFSSTVGTIPSLPMMHISFEQFQTTLQQQYTSWTKEEDDCVYAYLYAYVYNFYSTIQYDLFAISPMHLLESLYIMLLHYRMPLQFPPTKWFSVETGTCSPQQTIQFEKLMTQHSLIDILLRVYLWCQVNDLLTVFLPLIIPYDNSSSSSSTLNSPASATTGLITHSLHNHPADLLKGFRTYLFPQMRTCWYSRQQSFFQRHMHDRCQNILLYYQSLPIATSHVIIPNTSVDSPQDSLLESEENDNKNINALYATPQKKQLSSFQSPTSSVVSAFHSSLNPPANASNAPGFASPYSSVSVRGIDGTPLQSATLPSHFYQQSHFPTFQPIAKPFPVPVNDNYPLADNVVNQSDSSATPAIISEEHKNSAMIPLYYPLVIQQQLALHLIPSHIRYDHLLSTLSAPSCAWTITQFFQATYLGQFQVYLEQLGHYFLHQLSVDYASLQAYLATVLPPGQLPTTATGANAINARTSALIVQQLQQLEHCTTLWENLFRLSCGGSGGTGDDLMITSLWSFYHSSSQNNIPSAQKSVPLLIRGLLQDTTVLSNLASSSGSLQPIESLFWKAIAIYSSSRDNHSTTSPISPSEWTLFALFVHTLCEQAQGLLDQLKVRLSQNSSNSDNEGFTLQEMNILLQVLYSLGIVIGIGLRGGVLPFLSLPGDFYALLANDWAKSSNFSHGIALTDCNQLQSTIYIALTMSLRMGLCSVYSESVWDFWTVEDIYTLFTGCSSPAISIPSGSTSTFGMFSLPQIIQTTDYDPSLSIRNTHIQLFWLAVYELSEQHRQLLWKALFVSSSSVVLSGEIGTNLATTPKRLHIMKPIATACLSPDTTNIMLFPQQSGISIPKYSSYHYMQLYIQQLIQSLSSPKK